MKNKFALKLLSLLMAVTIIAGLLPSYAVNADNTEVRGVWISFLEMQTMLTGKTEEEFTKNINTAFDNIKNYGLNTVYVQVRPYADALYPSKYFPWSHIVTGEEGVAPGFDPLKIMVDEAHNRSLKIEAWINPYRVRPAGNTKALSDDNQAQKWLDAGDRSVIKKDTLITYNPASTKAQNLIVNGVKEIVANYKVDGIHIDDYFYPVTGTDFDNTFDQKDYAAYKSNGGTMSRDDWRRNNVEKLIKKIYKGVKDINPKVLFGISPQSNIENNYKLHYFDAEKIAKNTGYCDYLAPQIYFGFDHVKQPYAKVWSDWNDLMGEARVDLYVGIAAYKAGKPDSYAGAGKNEWVNCSNMMTEMVKEARTGNHYGGFILYRYDQLFRPENNMKNHMSKERANLKKLF